MGIHLAEQYEQDGRTDSEWLENTESNCESREKTRSIEKRCSLERNQFVCAECWLEREIGNAKAESPVQFMFSLYFYVTNNHMYK